MGQPRGCAPPACARRTRRAAARGPHGSALL